MKKIAILIGITLAVALASTSVMANCIPAKTGTNVLGASYSYIAFGNANPDPANFIGSFWQTDSPGLANSGTYDVTSWLFNPGPAYPDYWYFYLNLGAAGVNGCPATSLTVYVEDLLTNQFILWTADEGVGPTNGNTDFDFTGASGGTGFATPGAAPWPRVGSSSRAGSNVTVNFTVPDPSAGVFVNGTSGGITGVTVYAQSSNGAPSSNSLAGWNSVATLPAAGGPGSVSLDCSNTANDQWLATGISVAGQAPQVLSKAVQVECDPNLADPDGRFKLIDRPTKPGRREVTKQQ